MQLFCLCTKHKSIKINTLIDIFNPWMIENIVKQYVTVE